MKNNVSEIIRWGVSVLVILAVAAFIIIATSTRPQASIQFDDTQPLEERLREIGVPLKSFSISNKLPLEIEIVIQSSGNNGTLSQDDILYKFLAERQVELAHINFGVTIKSYRIILVTEDGNQLYDGTIYLSSDMPSQKVTKLAPSSLNTSETKALLEKSIDLHGFDLVSVDIPSSNLAGENSTYVTLNLSTGTNIEKTNVDQIDNFFVSVNSQVGAINKRYGARIAIVHIQIKDASGILLVNYLEDFDTRKKSFWVDEHIDAGWFPQPAPMRTSRPLETDAPFVRTTPTLPEKTRIISPTSLPSPYPPPEVKAPAQYP